MTGCLAAKGLGVHQHGVIVYWSNQDQVFMAGGWRSDVSGRPSVAALHGFIKKTRRAPDEDLALARKRQKELEE